MLVPSDMVARKPPHGAPCNRCGVCCMATLCSLGAHVFAQHLGPCPALEHDVDGNHNCGMVKNPWLYAPELALRHSVARLAAAARWIVGAGYGCDARINGEPVNAPFNARLEVWDREHEAEVAAGKAMWGMAP